MANLVKELRDTMSLRSVRVLVSPTPVTFAERRSVLALLQKSGPIEHFKMVQVCVFGNRLVGKFARLGLDLTARLRSPIIQTLLL